VSHGAPECAVSRELFNGCRAVSYSFRNSVDLPQQKPEAGALFAAPQYDK
jgi:hypothetical protein